MNDVVTEGTFINMLNLRSLSMVSLLNAQCWRAIIHFNSVWQLLPLYVQLAVSPMLVSRGGVELSKISDLAHA